MQHSDVANSDQILTPHTSSNGKVANLLPFSAIVGQEQLKKALLLNCIFPAIGGTLISGEKGTAKSTIVRALASLLPEMKVITLPLNATEDNVLGSINIETALQKGTTEFQPGILSKAHGNILYIDEVNLLSDDIISIILNAAASGTCTIEREGISHVFQSRFILIGSMNPEEGSLRPQILDRFGFYVDICGEHDLRSRIEIMKNRLAFEDHPEIFRRKYREGENSMRTKILAAKQFLKEVNIDDHIVELIAETCHRSSIAGHRGDLAFCRGVQAHAAFEHRKDVNEKDIEAIQELVLAHRARSFQPPSPPHQNPTDNNDQEENPDTQSDCEQEEKEERPHQHEIDMSDDRKDDENNHSSQEDTFDIGAIQLKPDIIPNIKDKHYRALGSGKRSKTRTHSKQGHYVKVKLPGKNIHDLAFDATLRAAAPFQRIRKKKGKAISIHPQDVRVKIREKRVGNTILFLLDASGSMGAGRRMTEAKAAVFELLKESYKNRDTVGLMKFNKDNAALVLPPTRSLTLALQQLKDIKTGGKTPLSEGLQKAVQLMKAQYQKNPEILPVIIIMSDGRANFTHKGNHPLDAALSTAKKASKEKIRFIVIDTESGFVRLRMALKLAEALSAEYYCLDDLKQIKEIVN